MRSYRTQLERLQRVADAQRRPQADAQRRERERLDAMTDDQLAREVEALTYVWELVEQWQRDGFSD